MLYAHVLSKLRARITRCSVSCMLRRIFFVNLWIRCSPSFVSHMSSYRSVEVFQEAVRYVITASKEVTPVN